MSPTCSPAALEGALPEAESKLTLAFGCEFIDGVDWFHAATSHLVATLDDADVSRGLDDIKRGRRLKRAFIEIDTPAYAVSLALALAGIIRMTFLGWPMSERTLRQRVRELTKTQCPLVRSLGLIPKPIDFAAAIGGGTGLVL